jgi:DNA-directed RNA polymerase subunit omega
MKRVPNRFLLVNMVAKRVRQIREGSEYLVSAPKNEDIVIALREIAAGKIVLKQDKQADKQVKKPEMIAEDKQLENDEIEPKND